jgi:DNA polymerase I-like protein with 3'-5' exonuclease and polymerase domains
MSSDLKSKLAALAAQHKSTQAANLPATRKLVEGQVCAAFVGTPADAEYIPHLKGMFNGLNTYVTTDKIESLSHLQMYCSKRGVTKVVSTSVVLLNRCIEKIKNDVKPVETISDYAGSLFDHCGIEIVFINPLSQLFSVSYGKFLAARYISKIAAPNVWQEPTPFVWCMVDEHTVERHYQEFQNAYAISADIETFKENLVIRCISFTAVFVCPTTGSIRTSTICMAVDSEFALAWMRKFCALPQAKIFQNGKYDVSYLLRYSSAPANWMWDTAHLFHSWYSELPKDLGFLNAFFLRKVVYWKDLAETNDLLEYYRYNCLDSWATANVWIQQMLQLPEWARRNYFLEFPLVFPCLLAEMTGLERDQERLLEARRQIDAAEEKKLALLRKIVDVPDFNPGSPPQVKLLLKALGCGDLDSTGAKDIAKAKLRHPLNGYILEFISKAADEAGSVEEFSIRGLRKLKTNYLRTDDDAVKTGKYAGEKGAKEFKGRILYALNPHGTDTGRLASKSHHFWCGLQVQNIPRGKEVKQTLRASGDFYLGECDLEQAESRDTAHIAGDESLIRAVTGTDDFHSVNCSAFFGVPYPEIYDNQTRKTRNKKLRDLAKRVNHGANYNMGPAVLVDTMGLDKIWEAKKLLSLPYTSPLEIAQHLLDAFHRTYPAIRSNYYEWVKREIKIHKRLASRAFHHTEYNLANFDCDKYISEGDWTRHCFGNPDKNKLDLNSYVAHCPQSLNARTLNEAFLKVFYEIALPNPTTFRLHAQIHDSILFSYHPTGGADLPNRVRDCMQIPVSVRDVSGIQRTFTVPASLKLGKKDKVTGEFKPAVYWCDTE